jgi:very-short-patch-repair endonuclease
VTPARKFLWYDPKLKKVARLLRKNSTLAEILLWNKLKRKQVLGYDFHRQKPVDKYVVDLFCPRLMLAVEIDGSSHDDRLDEDNLRQRELEQRGIRFLRFTDEDVKRNLEGVLEQIQGWILEHERTHP